MREIVITKNDAGQRLDKFLQKSLRLPPALMYRYLRKKRIKRNGQRAAGGDVLREGDRLSLYIGDEFFEAAPRARHTGFPPPQIIYEDESVLVLNKPQGLLSHGGPEEDTLINRMLGYLESTGAYDPRPQHGRAGSRRKDGGGAARAQRLYPGPVHPQVLQLSCTRLSACASRRACG